jgi:hypothetical protein
MLRPDHQLVFFSCHVNRRLSSLILSLPKRCLWHIPNWLMRYFRHYCSITSSTLQCFRCDRVSKLRNIVDELLICVPVANAWCDDFAVRFIVFYSPALGLPATTTGDATPTHASSARHIRTTARSTTTTTTAAATASNLLSWPCPSCAAGSASKRALSSERPGH